MEAIIAITLMVVVVGIILTTYIKFKNRNK
jgi:hypothetical protein